MNRKQLEDACKRLYENSNVDLTDCDLFSSLIKKHFDSTKNTAEFNHFKLYANSTLKAMTKDELIDYVHLLHHNWGASDERSKNIKNYADILHEKEVPKKPVYKKDYVGESNYFCSRCDSLMPFTLNRTAQIKYPFCPYCGQKLDWSDEK